MSNHKAGKTARQKDAVTSRQTKGAGDRPIPTNDVSVGDRTRRAATHLIPEEHRRPGAIITGDTRGSLANVPANETPAPHVLDPEGHAKRIADNAEETRKLTRKRNEDIAKAGDDTTGAGSISPRAPRTSRDRAIISGKPYDNSQAGDFRDSSQKDGKAPEERFLHGRGNEIGKGKTAQQANDLQRPEASTASTEASKTKEEEEGAKTKTK